MIHLVQRAIGAWSLQTSTPVTAVFSHAVTAGNTVIVAAMGIPVSPGVTPFAVPTDNATGGSDTFHTVVAPNLSSTMQNVAVYEAYGVAAGVTTVTMNQPSDLVGGQLFWPDVKLTAFEVSGLVSGDPFDQAANNFDNGPGAPPASGNTSVLSQPSEFMVGVFAANSSVILGGAGAGWGGFESSVGAQGVGGTETRIVDSAAAYAATFTSNQPSWACAIATFKDAIAIEPMIGSGGAGARRRHRMVLQDDEETLLLTGVL